MSHWCIVCLVGGVGAGTVHIKCDESADVNSRPDVVLVSSID